MQKVVIIGTGGTIAGQSASQADLTGYQAGTLGIEEIMKAVPALKTYEPLESIQFSNIESSDITLPQWSDLQALVQTTVERSDVAGVVITHGTDSMEETAYLLHLTVKTKKPIVLTGAMRPASAISAEGPLNLLQAVQTVRTPSAYGKGVLVLLNGYIDGAREVRKMNTTNAATFGNAEFGHMGIVQDGRAHFYFASTRCHTYDSDLEIPAADAWPQVEIFHLYAGVGEGVIEAVAKAPLDGLILAGLGHGTIPKQVKLGLKKVPFVKVRSSRTTSGMVSTVPSDGVEGFLTADTLTPEKARILLLLGLAKGLSKQELQKLFSLY